jgi:chromosome segregation ATPase
MSSLEDYIRKTEGIIRALKDDLSFYRAQNDSLQAERSEQLKVLASGDYLARDDDGLEGDVRFLGSERDRLAAEVRPLRQENRELKQRCAELEAALADARRKYEEARQVLAYLEAHIEQIESVVELLGEHKRFMKDLGD